MGEDQREPPHAVGGEPLEVEVLDDEDPVVDVEDLRHAERPPGILRRDRAVAPGVTAGQRDPMLGQPLRQLAARPRLARR